MCHFHKEREPLLFNLIIALTMLNPDIVCYGNSVDPDQLASKKLADQNPQFSLGLLIYGLVFLECFFFNSIPTFKNGVDLDQLALSILINTYEP